jgi:hypothetical protein
LKNLDPDFWQNPGFLFLFLPLLSNLATSLPFPSSLIKRNKLYIPVSVENKNILLAKIPASIRNVLIFQTGNSGANPSPGRFTFRRGKAS